MIDDTYKISLGNSQCYIHDGQDLDIVYRSSAEEARSMMRDYGEDYDIDMMREENDRWLPRASV